MYNIESLPRCYRGDDGHDIEAPTYHLTGECFLGMPGGPPSQYYEGDEITTDLIPNHAFRPLNKAAGVIYNEWEQSLPPEASAASPEDLLEAARQISQENVGQPPLSTYLWNKMVYERAIETRAMREGRRLPTSPAAQHLSHANGANIPLMTNANIRDLAGPGHDTGVKSHGPAAAKRVRRAPVLTNQPSMPLADAVEKTMGA